jgi:formate-dependent nitrite reductase membrane component NrfD
MDIRAALKPPVWTWEVPAYFFVGGVAGTAALLALTDADVAVHARWIAAAGALIAAPLLISDLGRPARFLYMLRVFKVRSPMSVGAWTLMVFSAAAFVSLAVHAMAPDAGPALTLAGTVAGVVAAATGLVLATYTGVLLGVTAIPVWAANARVLPILFGISGLGAAVSLLEVVGDRTGRLNLVGMAAAAVETILLLWIERRRDTASAPLRHGSSATLVRSAGILSGPVALVVRAVSLALPPVRLVASVAMIAGSALTRVGWIAAGRVSAHDRESALR